MTAPANRLEGVLYRDRAIVVATLVVLTLLAWAYLVAMVLDMSRGDMSLMGMGTIAMEGVGADSAMPMSAQPWTIVTFILMLLMWWVMMVGMMVPSAAPMILIYARVQRQKLPDENPVLRSVLFTLGYVVMWLVFSLIATALQWQLSEATLLSPVMESTSNYFAGAVFGAAGLYQLTPLKRACLIHCRSPLHFLSMHWRQGDVGALRMGLGHGAYCVGCCWFLMGLLFFGGVMNLLWVATIAGFVLLEKIVPHGQLVSKVTGFVMIGFAIYLLFGA